MKGRTLSSSSLIKKSNGSMMPTSSVVDANFLVVGSEIMKGNIIKGVTGSGCNLFTSQNFRFVNSTATETDNENRIFP